MEKILKQSDASVIITPYSFISSKKFQPLRVLLNYSNGEIYSFDNVPARIFNGRKHGIFNTNTSNSVRAAITVSRNDNRKGYRLTHLIRFKNKEREKLLKCDVLENYLSNDYQIIDDKNTTFHKCNKELLNVFNNWRDISDGKTIKDFVSNTGEYVLSLPNTCRYFTSGTNKLMNRNGQITFKFNDYDVFCLAYCMVNSSFAY